MNLKQFLCVMATCVGLFSCNSKAVVSEFESVEVEPFSAIIADSEVQCVDVRTEAEHLEGHIPGSLNIDVTKEDFSSLAQSKLNKNQKVAIYCRSGNRSKKAAALLQHMGFDVVELASGFNGWKQAGKAFEK